MSFWGQFDDFDPLKGRVSNYPFDILPSIAFRARALLLRRDREEVVSAAEIVDGIIEDFFRRELNGFIEDQIDNDGWAKEYLIEVKAAGGDIATYVENDLPQHAGANDHIEFSDGDNTSEVEALKICIDDYDIEDEWFKEATQSELFAVLALWLLADSLQWARSNTRYDAQLARRTSNGSFILAGAAAIKAMEAVCHAELLEALEKTSEETRNLRSRLKQSNSDIEKKTDQKAAERRSENARAAAAVRHEENAALKQEALAHYEMHKHQYNSVQDAARKIADKIVPVKSRTVARWISANNKNQLGA
jgi:hypothetical protein